MKKIKYLVLALVAVSVLSCKEECTIDKPKDLQPIDWEGWNDVYTVYWNSLQLCDEPAGEIDGKIVKVYGWSYDLVYFYNNAEDAAEKTSPAIEIIGLEEQERNPGQYYIIGHIKYRPCPEPDFCTSRTIIVADSIYTEK